MTDKVLRNDFKIVVAQKNKTAFTPRIALKLAPVDEVILETQEKAEDWANRKAIGRLRGLSEKLIEGLRIMVKDGKTMKVPTFAVGAMNRKCFGKYTAGRNSLGIPEIVLVNETRLSELDDGAAALHLLMLLLCCWRHQTGGIGRLDGIAKDRLRAYGLHLGKKGVQEIDPTGLFAQTLAAGGIPPPNVVPQVDGEGKSSNRLWSCRCQKARIGTKQFFAECTKCGYEFEIGDHVGKWPAAETNLAEPRD